MRPVGVAAGVAALLVLWAFGSVREAVMGPVAVAVVVTALLIAVPGLGLYFMTTRRRVLGYYNIPDKKAQRLAHGTGGASSTDRSWRGPS
jgi:hypothetical protein